MPRNLTCLTLATLMVAGQLSPAPLLAKPTASASAKAPVDAAGWMRPDPKLDRFIAELIAKVTLDGKVGQLNILTSNWAQTDPPKRHVNKDVTAPSPDGAHLN